MFYWKFFSIGFIHLRINIIYSFNETEYGISFIPIHYFYRYQWFESLFL